LQVRRAAAHEVFASFLSSRIAFLWCSCSFASSSAACAGETRGKAEGRKEAAIPEEKVVQTKHSLKIDGKGDQVQPRRPEHSAEARGRNAKASIFYVAYTKMTSAMQASAQLLQL